MDILNVEQTLVDYKIKHHLDLVVLKNLKTGKEAGTFLVKDQSNDKVYALKVYKDHTLRSFKSNQVYLAGKWIKKPSIRKAVNQKTKFGKDFIQKGWVQREFYMLEKLYAAGANIPQPFYCTTDSILMEYIGNLDNPAPKLKEVTLDKEEAQKAFETIMHNIQLFYTNGIVHADLSPFNILYWEGNPYIIDFPQSADVRQNPNAEELLKRDVKNVEDYFSK